MLELEGKVVMLECVHLVVFLYYEKRVVESECPERSEAMGCLETMWGLIFVQLEIGSFLRDTFIPFYACHVVLFRGDHVTKLTSRSMILSSPSLEPSSTIAWNIVRMLKSCRDR